MSHVTGEETGLKPLPSKQKNERDTNEGAQYPRDSHHPAGFRHRGALRGRSLALSACGGSASTAPSSEAAKPDLKAAGAGVITMWVDAERSPALKDITEKFKSDTGIEVKLVVKDFAAVRDDFITQVPTGQGGPDLIVGPPRLDWKVRPERCDRTRRAG